MLRGRFGEPGVATLHDVATLEPARQAITEARQTPVPGNGGGE